MQVKILGNVRIELFLNFLKNMFQYSLWKHPDTLPGQQNKQKAQVEPPQPPCLVWQEPSWPGSLRMGTVRLVVTLAVADTFNHSLQDWELPHTVLWAQRNEVSSSK